jgi:hypothetical protein
LAQPWKRQSRWLGLAKTVEIVSEIPTAGTRETSFDVPANSSFLLAAVSGHNVEVDISKPELGGSKERAFREPIDTPEHFAHIKDGNSVLGIMKTPPPGRWDVVVKSKGESAFSFDMMTFDEDAIR